MSKRKDQSEGPGQARAECVPVLQTAPPVSISSGGKLLIKEAASRLGIKPTTLYDWLGRSDGEKYKNDPPKKGVQLYDLAKDIGETKNLAAAEPQMVERLQAVYQKMTEDLKKGKLP